jgi:serine phosphatase RsbU (regulator of sigma subunit)/pSer/pThr/pTyr-binding forkhead associated (FHA) protein
VLVCEPAELPAKPFDFGERGAQRQGEAILHDGPLSPAKCRLAKFYSGWPIQANSFPIAPGESVTQYNDAMATLVILQGQNIGKRFPLGEQRAVIGRAPDVAIHLPSQAVSRRHAGVWFEDGTFFIEDLGSINGTLVNRRRIVGPTPLTDGDQVKLSDYVLGFQAEADAEDGAASILEQVDARVSNAALYTENPDEKLQTILLLAQNLGQTLELEPLLDRLLENLLQLLPLADRGLVVLCEGSQLIVRAQRTRRSGHADLSYSRTVIRTALEAGRGILSEDVYADEQFAASSSLEHIDATSLLCVPLIGHDAKPLGAIQLDCQQAGQAFDAEDLRLLTTVSLLAAVVVENAALNAVRIHEERLRHELALGRDIQFGFLPTDFTSPPGSDYEFYAHIDPAKEVSGDLYDFFPLDDGRLAFLVGDVSDKGIPAALFMVKVQTLVRHLAALTRNPSETLCRLNMALVQNNPSSMFVTLSHGLYDWRSGEVILASGGHPRPLLRHADGTVAELPMPVGPLLGCFEADLEAPDIHLTLGRGDTLVLFSDGYTEAAAPGTRKMLGLEPLKEVLGGAQTSLPLAACAEKARQAIKRFIGGGDLQDDLTLLLLRRR